MSTCNQVERDHINVIINEVRNTHDNLLKRINCNANENVKIIAESRKRLETFLGEIIERTDSHDSPTAAIDYVDELSKLFSLLSAACFNITSIVIKQRNKKITDKTVYDSCISMSTVSYLLGLNDGDCIHLSSSFSRSDFFLSIFSRGFPSTNPTADELLMYLPYTAWTTIPKSFNRKRKKNETQ